MITITRTVLFSVSCTNIPLCNVLLTS